MKEQQDTLLHQLDLKGWEYNSTVCQSQYNCTELKKGQLFPPSSLLY